MTVTTHEAIERANQAFAQAFNHGDAAAVARCYTQNARVLPPNGEPVTGRAAIEGFWRAVMGRGVATVTLETVELVDQEDTAYEVGQYTVTGAAGQQVDRGKYVVIWQRGLGEWLLHRDIWSSSEPART